MILGKPGGAWESEAGKGDRWQYRVHSQASFQGGLLGLIPLGNCGNESVYTTRPRVTHPGARKAGHSFSDNFSSPVSKLSRLQWPETAPAKEFQLLAFASSTSTLKTKICQE